MSNSAFMGWIRSEVIARLSHATNETDKTALLHLLLAEKGPSSILEVGLSLQNLQPNPVLDVLIRGASPEAIVQTWQRLERFNHTHNRTEVVDSKRQNAALALSVRHVALDTRPIDAVNHLFVWGALIGLTRLGGFDAPRVTVGRTSEVAIYESGRVTVAERIPDGCASANFVWHNTQKKFDPSQGEARAISALEQSECLSHKLEQLIRADITRSWKLREAAKKLSVSTRHLQRGLKQEDTSFSRIVMEVRVARAQELMKNKQVSLTEIAFCAGFADLAHFSRSARKILLVAPPEFRQLL